MFRMTVFGESAGAEDLPTVLQVRAPGATDEHYSEPADPDRPILDVLSGAREAWPDFDSYEPLLQRAIREGVASDLILGVSPETFSPLSGLKAASFGRFVADERLIDQLVARDRDEWAQSSPIDCTIEFGDEPLPAGQRVIRLVSIPDGEILGAMAFGSPRFVAPLPIGLLGFDRDRPPVIRIENDLTDSFDQREMLSIENALRTDVPDSDIVPVLVWRTYFGTNSDTQDGISTAEGDGFWIRARRALGTFGRDAANGFGIMVGRVALTASRRTRSDRGDPTAARRRRRLELADPTTTSACPDVRTVTTDLVSSVAPIEAVVAVHGTMSCAIPMTRAIHSLRDPENTRPPSILRFEHDTWLPIEDNAEELAAEIRRLRIRRILFVAHSRGGLVAARAAEIIASESDGAVSVDIIAVGSPFLGTPVADSARDGLLGVRALLGLVRAAGGAAIDAGTRLAGYMLRAELPPGISQMRARSTFIRLTSKAAQELFAVAGVAPTRSEHNTYGIAFLEGFTGELFAGEPNDLVVATTSGFGKSPHDRTQVSCDHFSYFKDKQTLAVIASKASAIKPVWEGTFTRRLGTETI